MEKEAAAHPAFVAKLRSVSELLDARVWLALFIVGGAVGVISFGIGQNYSNCTESTYARAIGSSTTDYGRSKTRSTGYEYSVDGRRYTGTTGGHVGGVTVFYNPNKPSQHYASKSGERVGAYANFIAIPSVIISLASLAILLSARS